MAKKSKYARSYIKMQSSESSHCYFLQKNRNNTKDRLQLKKYDPILRKHVLYKEAKM
jgi:large subunit ribosomal protein L33